MSADGPVDPLDPLIDAVSEGEPVDWKLAESASDLDLDALRALKDMQRIADFSRRLQRAEPENAPATPPPQPKGGKEPEHWGDLILLDRIGAGAKGEVWRAWDPALQRQVALKFLQSSESSSGGEAGTDLVAEARALARVRHPAVVAVHGIAEHGARAGMWMECLDGVTLAREIERAGPLPAREVARIGLEVCAALEALEGAGLVHGDIKPANIVLEPRGRVVLTDFGLGWRPALEEMEARRSFGTPLFMAPELHAGGNASPQSDIYALGVTLWWALTGSSPFQARTLPDLREETARGPSHSLDSVRPDAPRALVDAIQWAMNADPGARPQSAALLANRLRVALDPADVRQQSPRRSHRLRLAVSAAVGIAVGVLLLGRFLPGSGRDNTPSIAVLPFANLSGDPAQEYLSDGMTDELIARLAQVGGLRVISLTSVMPFKGSKLPLDEIARKLHVRMVVEGALLRAHDSVRVSAQLVDASTGRAVWSEIYERDWDHIFALHSDVALATVRGIRAKLTPRERGRLSMAPVMNAEAHALYLHGLQAFREQTGEGVGRAITLFRRALAIDSSYVDAWTWLAYAYEYSNNVGLMTRREADSLAVASAQRALRLDPENGPARTTLAAVQQYSRGDFPAAERSFREALDLCPGNADARAELVVLLTASGRFDEAIAEAKRARDTDPLSSMAATVSMYPLFEGRRYEEAIQMGRDFLSTQPNFPPIMLVLGQALFFSGRHDEGIAMIERAAKLDPEPVFVGWLGLLNGLMGKREKALEMRTQLIRADQKEHIDPYLFAIVDIGLGENARALDNLERARSELSGDELLLRVDPALDPLRREPRFQALAKAIKTD
jgi:serine/threonine protein kinase/tetratricopeptide (TPR) repeat protein